MRAASSIAGISWRAGDRSWPGPPAAADIHRLLYVLQKLVDAGNSVLVIEHNLDVIKCSDWVVDLGPEGGERGGKLLIEGTPETVARAKHSHTGRFLAPLLTR